MVFGAYKPPHALPMLATDRVLMQEVCYQVTTRLSKTLLKGKKGPWDLFPLTIGEFYHENFTESKVEDKEIKGFCFINMAIQKYDPRDIVVMHYKAIGFGWSYIHDQKNEEDKVNNSVRSLYY